MNRNFSQRYLEFTALVTLGVGLVLLFWPGRILEWFIPGATGDFFVRFIGSALVGYASLNHFAAREHERSARRLAIMSNIITLSIATLLSIAGVLSGSIVTNHALIIGEHVLFLSGFIYAYIKN